MSRNRREGRYVGHGFGLAVRRPLPSARVSNALARAYLRGRWWRAVYRIIAAQRRRTSVLAKPPVDQYGAQAGLMNQCDGCRCRWPLVNGIHRDPVGRNHIGCTAHLYR